MQVIEQFSQSKYGDDLRNEDAIVITDHYVAVIDGATDLSGIQLEGTTPGRFAAQTVKEAIECLSKDVDGHQAMKFIAEFLKIRKIDRDLPKEFRPFCVLAIYSKQNKQLFRLKDIQVKLNSKELDSTIRAMDAMIPFRQAVFHSRIEAGATTEELYKDDPFMPSMKALCYHQKSLENNNKSAWGFGVMNGEDIPERFIEIIDVPTGSDVIITSDGYPIVKDTLEASEAALRKLLVEDPLLIGTHPQPKGIKPGLDSFDDRSWLKIKT